MKRLSPDILEGFKIGINLLTGSKRRQYIAELCTRYFDSSPSKAERYFGVGRETVEKALAEARTGIRCVEAFGLRGRKKRGESSRSSQ